jgi:hypothetical protein
MDREGLLRRDSVFYSHMLPSLAAGAWRGNRVAGEAWLAVGDAGGLVDPFTGEGIYYAMRSGDLASQIVLMNRAELGKRPRRIALCWSANSPGIWNSPPVSPGAFSRAGSWAAASPKGPSNSCATVSAFVKFSRISSRASKPTRT